MSPFDELARRNRAYADSGRLALPNPMPKTGVLIVTCLDPRVEPAGFLGLEQNDALVVRNAGGRVNDAYLRLRAHFAEVARRWRDAGNLPAETVPEQVGAALLGLAQGFVLQHVLVSGATAQHYVAGLHALLPSSGA